MEEFNVVYASEEQIRRVLFEANSAGHAAAEAVVPKPMNVVQVDFNDRPIGQVYHVTGGVCGFAWVSFYGLHNTPLGKYLKAHGIAKKPYGAPGLQMWIGEYGQSMTRKEAFAAAFARVMKAHGCVRCYAGSRMD